VVKRSGSEASVQWQAKISVSKASLACRPRFRTLVTVSLLVEHLAGCEDWTAGVTLDTYFEHKNQFWEVESTRDGHMRSRVQEKMGEDETCFLC
jgi:hypothetical protein